MKITILLFLPCILLTACGPKTNSNASLDHAYSNDALTTNACLTGIGVAKNLKRNMTLAHNKVLSVMDEETEEIMDLFFDKYDWRNSGFKVVIRKSAEDFFNGLLSHSDETTGGHGFVLDGTIFLEHSPSLYHLYDHQSREQFAVSDEKIEAISAKKRIAGTCLFVHEFAHYIYFKYINANGMMNWCRYDFQNPNAYKFKASEIPHLNNLQGLERMNSIVQEACHLYFGLKTSADNLEDADFETLQKILRGSIFDSGIGNVELPDSK
ncbi:MAG: hypothetical protein KBD63_03320 [Bacteriovoracaceae bacterium]|nr:hypothetical protein [Bacteriovoracaceae bacterium]